MITVNTKDFQDKLKKALTFVPKKTSVAVLDAVNLRCEDGVYTLYTTNLETYVKVSGSYEGVGDNAQAVIYNPRGLLKSLGAFGYKTEISLAPTRFPLNVGKCPLVLIRLLLKSIRYFPGMKEIIEGQFKDYEYVVIGVNHNNSPVGIYNELHTGKSVIMPMVLDPK